MADEPDADADSLGLGAEENPCPAKKLKLDDNGGLLTDNRSGEASTSNFSIAEHSDENQMGVMENNLNSETGPKRRRHRQRLKDKIMPLFSVKGRTTKRQKKRYAALQKMVKIMTVKQATEKIRSCEIIPELGLMWSATHGTGYVLLNDATQKASGCPLRGREYCFPTHTYEIPGEFLFRPPRFKHDKNMVTLLALDGISLAISNDLYEPRSQGNVLLPKLDEECANVLTWSTHCKFYNTESGFFCANIQEIDPQSSMRKILTDYLSAKNTEDQKTEAKMPFFDMIQADSSDFNFKVYIAGFAYSIDEKLNEVDVDEPLWLLLKDRVVLDCPAFVVILNTDDKAVEKMKELTMNDQEKQASLDYYNTCMKRFTQLPEKKHGPDQISKRVSILREYFVKLAELGYGVSSQVASWTTRELLDYNILYFRYFPANLNAPRDPLKSLFNEVIKQLKMRNVAVMDVPSSKKKAFCYQTLCPPGFEFTTTILKEVENVFALAAAKKTKNLNPKPVEVLTPPESVILKNVVQVSNPGNETVAISLKPKVTDQSRNQKELVVEAPKASWKPMDKISKALSVAWRKLPLGDNPQFAATGFRGRINYLPTPAELTFDDYYSLKDMPRLCMARHRLEVNEVFHSHSCLPLIERFLQVFQWRLCENTTIQQDHSYLSKMFLPATIRIVTMGQGMASTFTNATNCAASVMMCALCYMQVIPFEMFKCIKTFAAEEIIMRQLIEVIAYACRDRFRHLSKMCNNYEFALLNNFDGNIGDIMSPKTIELYRDFIHRMRSSGMTYWSTHRVIKIPNNLIHPSMDLSIYIGNFFKFERCDDPVNWDPMKKDYCSDHARDDLDYYLLDAELTVESRYGCTDFEQGMLLPRNADIISICPITGSTRVVWQHTHMPKDPVAALVVRDFERRAPDNQWVRRINILLLDRLAEVWGRPVERTHKISYEEWGTLREVFHQNTAKINGIGYAFLHGSGKHCDIRTSQLIADSFVVSTLVTLGIIPREMYALIVNHGEEWIDPVLCACTTRFQIFVAQTNNKGYRILNNVRECRFLVSPGMQPHQCHPILYEFFTRTRTESFLYWTSNPVIGIPSHIRLPENHRYTQSFSFVQTQPSSVVPEPVEMPLIPSPMCKLLSFCYFLFETKPTSDITWTFTPMNIHTDSMIITMRKLLDLIAKITNVTVSSTTKREAGIGFSSTMCLTEDFEWLFTATASSSESEKNAEELSLIKLFRVLMNAGVIPVEILQLINLNEERLLYISRVMFHILMLTRALICGWKEKTKSSPVANSLVLRELRRSLSELWRKQIFPMPDSIIEYGHLYKYCRMMDAIEEEAFAETLTYNFTDGLSNDQLTALNQDCCAIIEDVEHSSPTPATEDANGSTSPEKYDIVDEAAIVPWQSNDSASSQRENEDDLDFEDDEYLD